MRHRLLILFFALFILVGIGCSKEESCEECKKVTYEGSDNNKVDEDDPEEYCGDELDEKKEYSSDTVGNRWEEYECS